MVPLRADLRVDLRRSVGTYGRGTSQIAALSKGPP